jgi:uncharacterized protein with PQ loop repeat
MPTMSVLLTSIVVAATVLGSWMAFPQARRIARTRRVEGVSPAWIGVSLAINAWWLTYGVAAGVWAWYFVAAAGRDGARGLVLGAFVLGMIPLPFLLIGGWELAGVAVGLSYGVQLLPAVVASLRTSSLSGVSSATWIIAFVEAGLWLVYGLGAGDRALTLAGVVGATMAAIILARLAVTGHRPFVVLDPRRRLEPAAAT